MGAGTGRSCHAANDLSPIQEHQEYNNGVTAGGSQMGNEAILNHLLKHIHMTDERSEMMAEQFDQLNRALITVLEGGGLGTNLVTPAQVLRSVGRSVRLGRLGGLP
jgi:hypothetical protein